MPMKKIYYSLLFAFFSSLTLQANPELCKGYVVTKNGIHLTGAIGDIFCSNIKSTVVFRNDLGTTYRYRPEIISGFVFEKDSSVIIYESKFDKERWTFLEVIEKGEGINLYKSPERKTKVVMEDAAIQTYDYRTDEYWVETKGRLPILIHRFNFRKKMRKIVFFLSPEISSKIGKQGYKYKDLQKIVREINKRYRKSKTI